MISGNRWILFPGILMLLNIDLYVPSFLVLEFWKFFALISQVFQHLGATRQEEAMFLDINLAFYMDSEIPEIWLKPWVKVWNPSKKSVKLIICFPIWVWWFEFTVSGLEEVFEFDDVFFLLLFLINITIKHCLMDSGWE